MRSLIALLGHRDSPTDGVQDYCEFLGRALERHGITLMLARVDWLEKGWRRSLRELWTSSRVWNGNWVIVQYTALAWSRRGFPFGAVAVLALLRCSGARCAVMFHEPHHNGGTNWLGRIRGACQFWVIKRIYKLSAKAIFADPLTTIRWLPKDDSKAIFIPIGTNIPERTSSLGNTPQAGGTKTVAIFCVTGAPHAAIEIADIAQAARHAAMGDSTLRFLFFGRGTPEANEQIIREFRDIPVEVSVLGVLDGDVVSDLLAAADVMLCVRGAIYPRRGTAIAGIACGLPIVCYEGPDTGFPITEAGLELVPYRDREALGQALKRVLAHAHLRRELGIRSSRAHAKYFSWESIAERFMTELLDE